jgi:trehalose/maltose hydrolase-like predicted phosphorylase
VGHSTLLTRRFACIARPGTAVLVADVDPRLLREHEPARDPVTSMSHSQRHSTFGGGATVTGSTTWSGAPPGHGVRQHLERIVVHLVSATRTPTRSKAVQLLTEATAAGAFRLLAEQRTAWDRRWSQADVEVVGDPRSTMAVRFAIFHLLSTVRPRGEAAVGARGLTGPAYAGHVFWDTEAFVMPLIAGVDSRSARAVLEYRIRRLPPARRRAALDGRSGARFPWESAHSGADVTPTSGIDHKGRTVTIRTGDLEEHVTADVAWAAWRYAAWIGDWSFLTGPGRPLVVDTARYWASRIRWDADHRAHIDSVTGPDEYHECVNDNAFTNLMARWNLRRAAELVERGKPGEVRDGEAEESDVWRTAADALVDNFDPVTHLYEQFDGFDRLQPLMAKDLGVPPFSADLVIGAERLAGTQIIKQADVLMAHLLIPEGTAPGSLEPNLDHYLPRTSHGSSLSPAAHAVLLARAGRPGEALDHLRLAASVDLDDVTQTTGAGLHVANLGGIWQAMVYGFAGLSVISPDDRTLSLDPVLPEAWEELRIRVRWHRRRLRLVCRNDAVHVGTDRPLRVTVRGTTVRVEPPGRWVA